MIKRNCDFTNAKWIGKKYHSIKHSRKKEESIIHHSNSILRRFFDKSLGNLGFQNREFVEAPFFRKVINVNNIKSAKVSITGLGYFELYINGQKVGDDILSPPFSQYEKTTYYLSYDIKSYLKEGENVFGVVLGNGMFNVHLNNAWNYDTTHWRSFPKFILSGVIEADRNISIVSDDTWKVTTGPIISDDIYGGETYDARLELYDWMDSSIDDSSWGDIKIYSSPTETLKPLDMPPMKIIKQIKPVNYWKIGDKKWVFDLGVNTTGFVRLKSAATKGTEVTLTYAEMLNGKELDRKALLEHTVKKDHKYIQKDRYIFKGEGMEEWQPRFTYHGFQYVEAHGLESVDESTILGLEIHTDLKEIGGFSCSNELLNKIFIAGNQSNLNNFQGLPTDCPHREKNGWTGDVNLSIDYNLLCYDSEHIFKKWLNDIADNQKKNGQIPAIAPTSGWGFDGFSGPAWDSALIIIPWHIFLYRGDTKFLESMYETMKKYMTWQTGKAKNDIITYGLGDWCSPNRVAHKPKCPIAITSTGYHYDSTKLMAKIAEVLGRSKDVLKYKEQAERIHSAFNKKFVDRETGFIEGDCQASYAAALFFGFISDDLTQKVLDRLIGHVKEQNYHLDTGILGTRFLLDVLSRYGRGDLAYKIATQTDFPSWGLWIEQGATTLWENWNGEQSRNHRMFGSISSWFLCNLTGIQMDDKFPGGKKVNIRPDFNNDLTWAKGYTETDSGKLSVYWHRIENRITLKIDAPSDVDITIYLDSSYECEIDSTCKYEILYI
ncbi:MAG: glycoside hydrolase family 78 protein [Spirochaetaceae bacterium]